VYDIHAANETWEWVDLKEIPPEDIRWDGEESGVALNIGHGSASFRGNRRGQIHGGRGRGPRIHQPRRELVPPPTQQNGSGGRRTSSDDIELFNTDSLVKEVERVFDSTHPDPLELDKAKKMLKEHEQALIAAIARLADTSDGEMGNNNKSTLRLVCNLRIIYYLPLNFCVMMIISSIITNLILGKIIRELIHTCSACDFSVTCKQLNSLKYRSSS
jgi:hypothetical protein